MNKLTLLAACAVVAASTGVAQAQQPPTKNLGWYAQGNFFAGFAEKDRTRASGVVGDLKYDDPGWGGGGAVGYKFGNGFRLEGEISYAEYTFKELTANGATASLDGKNKVFSFTGNGYYDFTIWPMVNPYVGGGLGLAHTDRGSTSATLNGVTVSVPGGAKEDFTIVAEAGLNIDLAPNIQLVPAYRFQWIEDGRSGVSDDHIHQARLGLRYMF